MKDQSTLIAQIPDPLDESLNDFLELNPCWDVDRLTTAALAMFLMQHPGAAGYDRRAAQAYLAAMFPNTPARGRN